MSKKLPDDGLVLVVKEDCPTCRLIAPVAAELEERGLVVAVYSQDNPDFPARVRVTDDRDLEASFHLGITIVPTLVRFAAGRETGRANGWAKEEWRSLAGIRDLGSELPAERPGCGSLSAEEGWAEELLARHGDTGLGSATVPAPFPEDPFEVMFERGWTDGLPVVPPTPARVLRMLQASRLANDHVLGLIPPSGAACTVEKAAINAVMAGCRPEYLPVVLAALDAALDPDFAWQGLLSTTMGAGVCVVVNGPVARRIGINSGFNVLGHGNRANATIARALLLIAMNIGGARPGGVDRSTQGHPGKHGLCFAEDESDPAWRSLADSRGIGEGRSAVTVFGFCGTHIMSDQTARTPDELVESLALSLNGIIHPRSTGGGVGAMLMIGGEFWRTFRESGWSRPRIEGAIHEATKRPRVLPVHSPTGTSGTGGLFARFAPGDLLVTRAGSNAGLFSTIIQGWGSGPSGSQPVTREVMS